MLQENDKLTNIWITKDLTYMKVYNVLKDITNRSYSFTLDLKAMQVSNELDLHLRTIGGKDVYVPMTRWALSQLCQTLGIPVSYIKNCLAVPQNKDLATLNLNRWVEYYKDKTILVNTVDTIARGILSPNFYIIDSDYLFYHTGRTYREKEFEITGATVSTEYCKLRFRRIAPLPINGLEVYPVVILENSCVGRSSLNLNVALQYANSSSTIQLPNLVKHGFKKSLVALNHSNSRLQGIDRIIFDSKRYFDSMIDNLTTIVQYLNSKQITMELAENLLENLVNNYQLSQEVIDKIKNNVYQTHPTTQWQFIQAVSEVSNNDTATQAIRDSIEESTSYLIAFGMK